MSLVLPLFTANASKSLPLTESASAPSFSLTDRFIYSRCKKKFKTCLIFVFRLLVSILTDVSFVHQFPIFNCEILITIGMDIDFSKNSCPFPVTTFNIFLQ